MPPRKTKPVSDIPDESLSITFRTGTNVQPVDIVLHHLGKTSPEGEGRETLMISGTGHLEKPDGAAKDWTPPYPKEITVEGPAARFILERGQVDVFRGLGLEVSVPAGLA